MRDPVNTRHDKRHSQHVTTYHLFFVMLLVIHYASLSGLPFFAKYVHVLNQSSAQKLNFVILKNIGGTLMMQTVVGLAVFFYLQRIFFMICACDVLRQIT